VNPPFRCHSKAATNTITNSMVGSLLYKYSAWSRSQATGLVSWQEQGWTITFRPVEGCVRVPQGPKASRKEFSA
jgi:hypothetical protein